MLTVRLSLAGVLSAFQTNRVVSLIKRGDEEFDALMNSLPESEYPGVFDVSENQFTPVTSRSPMHGKPVAMVKIDECRNEHGDMCDDRAYSSGARFIGLYGDDTAIVLDCGAKLFCWGVRE